MPYMTNNSVCEVKYVTMGGIEMNYKKMIIEMVQGIGNEGILEYLETFIRLLIKRTEK